MIYFCIAERTVPAWNNEALRPSWCPPHPAFSCWNASFHYHYPYWQGIKEHGFKVTPRSRWPRCPPQVGIKVVQGTSSSIPRFTLLKYSDYEESYMPEEFPWWYPARSGQLCICSWVLTWSWKCPRVVLLSFARLVKSSQLSTRRHFLLVWCAFHTFSSRTTHFLKSKYFSRYGQSYLIMRYPRW